MNYLIKRILRIHFIIKILHCSASFSLYKLITRFSILQNYLEKKKFCFCVFPFIYIYYLIQYLSRYTLIIKPCAYREKINILISRNRYVLPFFLVPFLYYYTIYIPYSLYSLWSLGILLSNEDRFFALSGSIIQLGGSVNIRFQNISFILFCTFVRYKLVTRFSIPQNYSEKRSFAFVCSFSHFWWNKNELSYSLINVSLAVSS